MARHSELTQRRSIIDVLCTRPMCLALLRSFGAMSNLRAPAVFGGVLLIINAWCVLLVIMWGGNCDSRHESTGTVGSTLVAPTPDCSAIPRVLGIGHSEPDSLRASDELGKFLRTQGYFSADLELVHRRVVARGQVNDHPISFAIDTASSHSFLFQDVVDSLKLPICSRTLTLTTNFNRTGVRPTSSAIVERLKLGPATFSRGYFLVDDDFKDLNVDELRKLRLKDPFSGIIGDDILASNHAIIDLSCKRLFFQTSAIDNHIGNDLSAILKKADYHLVPCVGRPMSRVSCATGSVSLNLLLDTGSRVTMFDHSTADRIGLRGTLLPPDTELYVGPGQRPTVKGKLPESLVFPGGPEVGKDSQ
jgi:hypothetical protein